MSFAVPQLRLLTLQDYTSNLETQITSIVNQKLILSYQMTSLIGVDQDSPEVLAVHYKDQQLDLIQKQLETQLKAANAELESIKKLVETNAKRDGTLNITA